jgi:hydrogenase maturation factor HypE
MIHSVSKTMVGNGTYQIGSRLRGRILAVKVTSDSDVTNAFDMELTGAVTGIPILTETTIANNGTVWWHPRALVAKQADGAAATDAFAEIPVVNEAIQCVIANAGTTGTLTVTVIYDTWE